jgi:hypothetical protein
LEVVEFFDAIALDFGLVVFVLIDVGLYQDEQ